jgi:outer membrane autotransporter protein
MLDPFVGERGNLAGPASGFAPEPRTIPSDVALAYDAVLKAPSFAPRWTAWGAGFGGSNSTDGDPAAGTTNVTAHTYGFAAGVDRHYDPDTVFGFAVAGGGTNWGLAQNLGGGRSDAFQAGIYGITHFGSAYLAAAADFTNHWMSTSRTAFAGDQLSASFAAQSYGARFESGYRLGLPAIGVTPYAALQIQGFHTPAYSETDLTGGGFGLSFNAATATDTRSELGARFDSAQMLGGMPLLLKARAAWAHDWVSIPSLAAVFETLPGASFVVNGAAAPANSALLSTGAELHVTPALSIATKFDGEFANGSQTYSGTGTLRYTW